MKVILRLARATLLFTVFFTRGAPAAGATAATDYGANAAAPAGRAVLARAVRRGELKTSLNIKKTTVLYLFMNSYIFDDRG